MSPQDELWYLMGQVIEKEKWLRIDSIGDRFAEIQLVPFDRRTVLTVADFIEHLREWVQT